jgi:hypothetical protein
MTPRKCLNQMSVGELLQEIPGMHARAMTTTDVVGPSGRDDLIVIEPQPPTVDQIGRARTRAATEQRQRQAAERRARARRLRDEGRTHGQIAVRMAQDEKRAAPYPERTVQRWLFEETPDATT